jgi:hypothetical protein
MALARPSTTRFEIVVMLVLVVASACGGGGSGSSKSVTSTTSRPSTSAPPEARTFGSAPLLDSTKVADAAPFVDQKATSGSVLSTRFVRAQSGDVAVMAPPSTTENGYDQAQTLGVLRVHERTFDRYQLPFERTDVTRIESFDDEPSSSTVALVIWSCTATVLDSGTSCAEPEHGWLVVGEKAGALKVALDLGVRGDRDTFRAVRFVDGAVTLVEAPEPNGSDLVDTTTVTVSRIVDGERQSIASVDGIAPGGNGGLEAQVCVVDDRLTFAKGSAELVQIVDGKVAPVAGTSRASQQGLSYLLCNGGVAWLQRGGATDSTLTVISGGRVSEISGIAKNAASTMAFATMWVDASTQHLLLGSMSDAAVVTGHADRVVDISPAGTITNVTDATLDVDVLLGCSVVPFGDSVYRLVASGEGIALQRQRSTRTGAA